MATVSCCTGQRALHPLPSKSLSDKRSVTNYSLSDSLLVDNVDSEGLPILKVAKVRAQDWEVGFLEFWGRSGIGILDYLGKLEFDHLRNCRIVLSAVVIFFGRYTSFRCVASVHHGGAARPSLFGWLASIAS